MSTIICTIIWIIFAACMFALLAVLMFNMISDTEVGRAIDERIAEFIRRESDDEHK